MIRILFSDGTLLLQGVTTAEQSLIQGLAVYDDRVQQWRAKASDYGPLIRRLFTQKVEFVDEAKEYETLPLELKTSFTPRPHQTASLEGWMAHQRRGLVVLPTGSGKSFVAQLAMQICKRPTVIVVPTIDLMHQWQSQLQRSFNMSVGLLGGGERDIQPITVTTYDSALIHFDTIGNQFGLIVFDECHHLPGERTRLAALSCIAPFRLGLTATPERNSESLDEYFPLIGALCHRVEIDELEGKVLAPYRVIRYELELDADEEESYHKNREVYLTFLRSCHINFNRPDAWAQFIISCVRETGGRAALDAYQEQKRIARGGRAKVRSIWQILQRHAGERAILFTADNATAYHIGRQFLLPVLTHMTKPAERRKMLERLRSGQHPVLVTSKVLNEGVDVPEVSVGIVVSGSGSIREHVQRLGRILRKGEGKKAVLYELVSANTSEVNTSERRREHRAYKRPH